MKKIITILMAAVIALMVSCENEKSDTKNEKAPSESAESNISNEASTETNDKSKELKSDKTETEASQNKTESSSSLVGKKKIYKEKLDKIQVDVKGLASTYGESTNGRKNAAGLEYDKWDGALNEIYNELKKDLSKSDMSKLEQEEKLWIKEKEEKAKAASEEMKGGTEEGVLYAASLAATTKERCYELVEKYMN